MTASLKLTRAKARLSAWRRILDAVAEMRAAIDHRIYLENPHDTHLEHDVQVWCELARALSAFLQARKTSR